MKVLFWALILMMVSNSVFAQSPESVGNGKCAGKLLFRNEKISDLQKKQFVELLKTLPVKGEFYAEESERKAAPYLLVLFALTEKDTEKYDIYPFLAISRGIFEQEEYSSCGVMYFDRIQHSMLKLFWAAVLFRENAASQEIITFLDQALDSPQQAKQLAEIVGPGFFEEFKQRLKAKSKQ
jgi:hypothetical protein